MNKATICFATSLTLSCLWWSSFQSAIAAPVNSTVFSASMSSNTTTTALPTTMKPSPGMERLSALCQHHVDYPDSTALDDSLLDSIATGLERFKTEHPANPLKRCVIKVPDGTELDAAIKGYNANKSITQKQHTAFLLAARGIKMSAPDQAKPCEGLTPVIAGLDDSSKDLPELLPSSWQNSFLIKEPIDLELGQKLIGIPLDTRSGALAEGYRVNIKREVKASIGCRHEHLGHIRYTRDHLITIRQPGSVVSGITNIDGINDSKSYRRRCSYLTHYPRIYADQMYTSLLSIELDVMSLNLPNGSRLVDISNNEFYQFENSAIDIKLAGHGLYSPWIRGSTFVRLFNNHVYSCFARGHRTSNQVPLNIDLRYHDADPDPATRHVLELKENQFDTQYKAAINLNVSPGSLSEIASNRLTTDKSPENSTAIKITGITSEQDGAKTPPSFRFSNNEMAGFESAIEFQGMMNLKLNSNKLLGTQYALKRTGEKPDFPVALSGDKHNVYTGLKPCATLENSRIKGGLLFADEMPCPEEYSPSPSPAVSSASPTRPSPSQNSD